MNKCFLFSALVALSLLVYGWVAGFKVSQVRSEVGDKLAEVEAVYPISLDGANADARELQYLQQLNDTISLYLKLYREQYDIMQGRASKPSLNDAQASNEWEARQNARLSSLQKSTLVLVSYMQNFGQKTLGKAAYQSMDKDTKTAVREGVKAKKAVAKHLFRNTEYIATDVQYFDYLLDVREMVGQAVCEECKRKM